MARGAFAAKAVMVVADHSSYPIDEIAAQAGTPFGYQMYDGPKIKRSVLASSAPSAPGAKRSS